VNLPRPRGRTSEDFIALYREVDGILREEIDRAFEAAGGEVVGD
jgi:hypothetical protein